MRRALLALILAALPAAALASPPFKGTAYTFADPIFNVTVICDTLEQLSSIARAPSPELAYATLRTQRNALNEPTCDALQATGVVLEVKPLGRMNRDGESFDAYAIKTQFGTRTLFALYLERIEIVRA